MRAVQYVSQKSVPESDVYMLSDREQDTFIKEVGDSMLREMRERVRDARPTNDAVSFWVTGPHTDPLQGVIHVHHIAAWFDLDTMATDAPFAIEAHGARSADTAPITGGEVAG